MPDLTLLLRLKVTSVSFLKGADVQNLTLLYFMFIINIVVVVIVSRTDTIREVEAFRNRAH